MKYNVTNKKIRTKSVKTIIKINKEPNKVKHAG